MITKDKELHYLYSIIVGFLLLAGMLVHSKHTESIETNKALSEAVKLALDKGIEPLAVTCAYELDETPSSLCVMYVNRIGTNNEVTVPLIKK